LVKTLHCEERNPYIQIENSPFYIVNAERDWQALHDADGRALPRRAGVSSFGFGGVNAHVILEEYAAAREGDPAAIDERPAAVLIPLSGRTEGCLADRARQLHDAIARGTVTETNLVDAAYTLQVGREPMECRLAFAASSLTDLRDKLARILESRDLPEGCYRGTARTRPSTDPAAPSQEELVIAVGRGDYGALLDAWVNGRPFDWRSLYGPASEYCRRQPRRMSLPTYAFSTESYWITERARPVGPSAQSGTTRTLDRDALEFLIGAHLTEEVGVDAAAKITELLASA
jgi:polyketide synthase PksN